MISQMHSFYSGNISMMANTLFYEYIIIIIRKTSLYILDKLMTKTVQR